MGARSFVHRSDSPFTLMYSYKNHTILDNKMCLHWFKMFISNFAHSGE